MVQYFTSESVTEGHPDKVCDRISDSILDACLEQDEYSRVAVETMVTSKGVILSGEVTTDAMVDYIQVARDAIKDIGYTDLSSRFNHLVDIQCYIHEQSSDIAQGVDIGGAGDQGIMFGGATRETEDLMPMPITIANYLSVRITELRKDGTYKWLKPDGKTQVTIPYVDGKISMDHQWTFLISVQHSESVKIIEIKETLVKKLLAEIAVVFKLSFDVLAKARVLVNPTGKFCIGGPEADTGLTGRKIIVDTYGGYFSHGGGAFSGKDPTKVDRSASYMARYLAMVALVKSNAQKAEVQLSYAIGVEQPLSIYVKTEGVYDKEQKIALSDEEIIEDFSKRDLSPTAIINSLNLRKVKYSKLSAGGHFGINANGCKWEMF